VGGVVTVLQITRSLVVAVALVAMPALETGQAQLQTRVPVAAEVGYW